MNNEKVTKVEVQKGGIGCFSTVGIVFVVLKLLGVPPVSAWSWIWVLCPFWIGFATVIVMFIAMVLFIALFTR